MPGSSLFTLIDDIATLLDDIAVLSKVAVQKTAGVLGDDLALNAQQVTGLNADRELPVVWAVAKGSLKNKAILVPSALAISLVARPLVVPLLMFGGAYLCFEGVEKLLHKWLHHDEESKHEQELAVAAADPKLDLVALEKERIFGAIRTDFILSAEIIVIALGEVVAYSFITQIAVLVAISLIMTVGVYGLVGGIVKMDDAGLALLKSQGDGGGQKMKRTFGKWLVLVSPKLLKVLSVLGTIAMFTVGGGIFVHGIPSLHHHLEHLAELAAEYTHLGWFMQFLTGTLLNIVVGLTLGAIVLLVVEICRRLIPSRKRKHDEAV